MSYLDKTGLTHFFEKLKGIFARKETEVPLILSTQTTNTGDWTGVAPFAELKEGQTIRYHLLRTPSGNASLQLTLSGGGTTTNLPIYFNKFNRLSTHFSAGSIITLTYGVDVQADQAGTKYTGWFVNDYRDSDTVTIGRWDTNAAKVGSGNKVFAYSLFMEKADGTFESIALSGGTGTGKTKNSAGFHPGRIWYNDSGTERASGAVLPYGAYYRQFDLRYSTNCAQTLTAQAPVYIVGTISNGLFYLDSTWYTQTLPTSDDGKVYMYLGGAYSTHQVAMHPDHPMYVYKDGRVQRYNGDQWHDHDAGDIVSGTLPVGRGGTGKTTAKDAANAFMNALDTGSSTPVDADYYISQYVGGGTTTTTYHRRPVSALLAYIKGKLSKSDVGLGNVDNVKQLPIAGGTMTGDILGNSTASLGSTANPFHKVVIGGATTATVTADSTNPQIVFQENTGTQPVKLVYSDYDSYRYPAGLKVVGGAKATPAWFEVEGTLYARKIQAALDPSLIDDGYTKSSFYINTHPENSPTIIPFINNDIAFLLKRGGSAVVKKDGVVWNVDISNVFDGSPSYWLNGASIMSGVEEITIELSLHRTFTYTNWIYIDFGANSWRAKHIKIEVMNSSSSYQDVWTTKGEITNNALGEYKVSVAHTPVGAANTGGGFNMIRFTLSDFASSLFRIAQIGVINYASAGLRETSMSRGIDDPIFRSITPNENNTYALGTSSKRWSDVYAQKGNFAGGITGDVTGKVNGHTVNADVPSGAKFTDTTYTAATAAPGKVASASSQGTSTNYARQDHTHGIDVGTGDANGQVKIAGQNASVKGLAALAYKASLGKSDVGLGNVDNTADADKEVKNATVLKTARNLSGIAFDGSKSIHRFGLCSTAANVAAKTVTLEDDMPFTLEKGAVVFVKMTNANSIANPTLDVNDTGAKAIKRYATTAPGTNADQSWVAGSVRGFVYDGSYWMVLDWGYTGNDNTIPQAYCSTAAGTAAKAASMTGYALLAKSFVMVNLTNSNTAAGPLTLTINSKGAKPIYINGAASSATHNSLPAGSYLVYYDGTNYYFRTDGKIAAEGFSGSGANLTDLNASELASGTVPTARLPVATEDANGIVNNTYIRKINELWETHEATTVNNSVVSGAFAITINAATSWRQDSYTDYWYTKINLPTIKRGAEIVIRYDDCQFLYMLEPPEDGWIEALDGEVWLYTKTLPDFSVINSPDWIRVSAYFINHTSIDSGRYDPPFKMEKIWENANPTATFPPQMLDLNLRAYDMAVIETLGLPSSNDQGICYVTGVIVKGVTSAIMGTAKTSNRVGLRKYTMSDEGIDIAEGIYNAAVNNNYFVPSRIYGIRGLSEFDVEPVWETWMEEGEENSNLFYEGFSASLQNNGNAVQDYGWRTYDGITGWLINTRAQGNSWAYLYSNDKIDVTNYSYIVVDCYFYCYGGAAYVGLTQQNAPAGNSPANVMQVYAHPVSTRTKYRGEVRLNVKDLTGEYRLVIASAGSGESSYQGYSMIISVKAR